MIRVAWPSHCTHPDTEPITKDMMLYCIEHEGLWNQQCGACREHRDRRFQREEDQIAQKLAGA